LFLSLFSFAYSLLPFIRSFHFRSHFVHFFYFLSFVPLFLHSLLSVFSSNLIYFLYPPIHPIYHIYFLLPEAFHFLSTCALCLAVLMLSFQRSAYVSATYKMSADMLSHIKIITAEMT
jgi:hypothetical protein